MENALLRSPLSNEILGYICSLCSQKTLATLARTSRQISSVALDTLWWELQHMGSLRHAMPPDVYTVDYDYLTVSALASAPIRYP